MGALNPFVSTDRNNIAVDLQNANRVATFGLTVPFDTATRADTGATLTAGDVITITSFNQAVSIFGTSADNGNYGIEWLEYLYNVSSATKVYVAYAGRNVASVTTTTIDEANGYQAGATLITVTSGTGITVDKLITIGTGATKEVRRVLGVATNDLTVAPLTYAHANAEAVVLLTEFATANLATCRTALKNFDFRFYVEDSYGATYHSAIKTFLNDRVDLELFTICHRGNKYGATKASFITESQDNNSKLMDFVYGDFELNSVRVEGNTGALITLANYAQRVITFKVQTIALISVNDVILKDVTAIYDSEDNTDILIPEANILVNSNVATVADKYILSVQAVRFHKVVTSYNKDGSSLPSKVYSNIVDREVEIELSLYLSQIVSDYLADRVLSDFKVPMTNKQDDLDDLQGLLQGKVNDLVYLNNDSTPATVLVSYDTVNDWIQVDVSYKAVISGDRVLITLYKQPSL